MKYLFFVLLFLTHVAYAIGDFTLSDDFVFWFLVISIGIVIILVALFVSIVWLIFSLMARLRKFFRSRINVKNILRSKSIVEVIDFGNGYRKKLPTTVTERDTKRLLLAIDIQNDFMEGIGSLGVQGSLNDVARLNQWIFNNIDKLSHIICSVDTHSIHQIFHPAWWIDAIGNHPAPFTIITQEDVKNGIWKTTSGNDDYALEYLQALEEKGHKALCIWPYHCLEGTIGHQLEASFIKMLYFHAAFHNTKTTFVAKGQNPQSEMYGIIKAEHDVNNEINLSVLKAIEAHDEIYIAGEASSHCVLASVVQIVDFFKDRREMTSRLILLEDCMSPIAGFEESTAKAFAMLSDRYGVQIRKSCEV